MSLNVLLRVDSDANRGIDAGRTGHPALQKYN
jgi:hypothetical protein